MRKAQAIIEEVQPLSDATFPAAPLSQLLQGPAEPPQQQHEEPTLEPAGRARASGSESSQHQPTIQCEEDSEDVSEPAVTLQDSPGVLLNLRPLTITMDGNQKLNHYEKCGRVLNQAQSEIASQHPQSTSKSIFFGPLQEAAPR